MNHLAPDNGRTAGSATSTHPSVERSSSSAPPVAQYLPLVHHAVRSLASRVPRYVAWDDLVSAGMLGLAEAARSYDQQRGVPFESFALTRIQGAMLDELRSLDWASRSVRVKARLIDERSSSLAVTLGRHPTPSEVGTELGMGAEDLPAGALAGPEESVLEGERRRYLRAAIENLPERLRVVVEGYFFAERLMQDIAADLGVTESRVSQMRAEALLLMRDGMNAHLDPDGEVDDMRSASVVGRRRAAYFDAIASSVQRPAQVH